MYIQIRLVFLALAATTLVTCDDGPGASDDDSPLALYGGEPSGDDALLTGTLVREGPCLYVQEGSFKHLLLLPASEAAWRDGALKMSERSARPGDRVGFGGGEASGLGQFDWERAPDPSCDASAVWVSDDDMQGGQP